MLLKVAERLGGALAMSNLYATPAVPEGSGPEFVNAALATRISADPERILAVLHECEAENDRERQERWGPRTLDLDLICCGEAVLPDPHEVREWINLSQDRQRVETPDRLILPHPRLQDRSFVLVPMAEVAPGWRHPLLDLTVEEMRDARPEEERRQIRAIS